MNLETAAKAERVRKERLALALAERKRRGQQKRFFDYFPDRDSRQRDGSTIHARDKYQKHLEFFRVGRTHRERCFMAANRVGKTFGGSFEMTCHLTGLYPDWWEGKVFSHPIRAWAAGKTNETTRDIVQSALLGEIVYDGGRKRVSGTGMIPGDKISALAWKKGLADLVDTVKIRHKSGGWSLLGFKSYEQGRGSFEGTAQHCIWLDEEPDRKIYGECAIRTMTTGGIIMLTFTPLEGMSQTVMQFLPEGMRLEDA